MSFISELKRRNVFRAAIGYVISTWLLAQVADLVLGTIGAPAWVMQTILLIFALGFPVVLFFSWAYEVTPEGIKRESEIDQAHSISPVTARKLDRAILVLLVLSLGYFIWESRFSDRDFEQSAEPAAAGEAIAPAESGVEPVGVESGSIAVLPFDNRSKLEDDIFFTEGIHDELLSNLAQIGSLKVISRTSVMRYQDTRLSIPEIGRELGVAAVLEGAVQRSGGTVRVNVQLIDALTDEHLWAQTYDRELTAENLFSIQTEISQIIARSLKTELSPEEEQRISTTPTTNLAAYDAYLRGRQNERLGGNDNLRAALNLYRQATDADPNFAAAWAGRALMVLYLRETGFWGEIPEQEAYVLAQTNIDRALAIDPQSAEAHSVQARMHYEQYRFREALDSLNRALTYNPNLAYAYREKAQVLSAMGEIQGAWEGILMSLDRDPFDRTGKMIAAELAWTYLGPEQAAQLQSRLADNPVGLGLLQVKRRIRSEAGMADIYRDFPRKAFGHLLVFKMDYFKEVSLAVMEKALHPMEIQMDIHTRSNRLDEALAAYYALSDERKMVTINLERLSIAQMAKGLCDKGIESLEKAHDGELRVYGQITPNDTRSNPNLALNWVYCMRQVGRAEEAASLMETLRAYIETLQREATYGYNKLLVKLHIIDGEIGQALDVYAQALDRRDIVWSDRFDPVIRTLARNPEFEELNARVDAEINAERAKLGWPPTEVVAFDSYEGQEEANNSF